MARGIKSICSRCGRHCVQSAGLVGIKPPICSRCRTKRDLTRPVVCECCDETKPLAEFLDPCGDINRNCRACINSGAVRLKAAQKRLETMRRKEAQAAQTPKPVKRRIEWPEIVIPGDPFSGEERCAG